MSLYMTLKSSGMMSLGRDDTNVSMSSKISGRSYAVLNNSSYSAGVLILSDALSVPLPEIRFSFTNFSATYVFLLSASRKQMQSMN